MKTFGSGLCALTVMAMCVGMASIATAADVWRASLEPVQEGDDAGGHVTIVLAQQNPADEVPKPDQLVVVASGLQPNTPYKVTLLFYKVVVTTNEAGILTLHDLLIVPAAIVLPVEIIGPEGKRLVAIVY